MAHILFSLVPVSLVIFFVSFVLNSVSLTLPI